MNPMAAQALYEVRYVLLGGSLIILAILAGFVWWQNHLWSKRKPVKKQPTARNVSAVPKRRANRRSRNPSGKGKP